MITSYINVIKNNFFSLLLFGMWVLVWNLFLYYVLLGKPRNASADASFVPPTLREGQNTSFHLIAYPTPVNVTKYFIGSNMNSYETPVSDDVFRVDCSSSSQWIYKITCTVTVIKVTSHAAGLYKAVVSNELGGVPLFFEALPQNTTGRDLT